MSKSSEVCHHCGSRAELVRPISAVTGRQGPAVRVCTSFQCRRETPVLFDDALELGLVQLKAA